MTTLTERLRELEADLRSHHSPSLILAQELHALLVECGNDIRVASACAENGATHAAIYNCLDEAREKLKQAGIV